MSSVFSTGVVTKHSIASKYLRLTKEVDDAGNIPKNSLTTKLGYHLPGPFEGAIPKTVVEIETWNSGWNENLNTQKIGRRRKSSKLNTDDDTGNIPKNGLTTGVLDADDGQMLLVNAAGSIRVG